MHAAPEAWVGIGLREPHLAEWLASPPALGFVEVHSENHFAEGGASVDALCAVRDHTAVSLHGVGLSLGSACGLDEAHLDALARLTERIDPVRVSDHACFARAPSSNRGRDGLVVHAADLLPVAFTPASLDILVRQVQQVQERLRRQICVENLSAYLHHADDRIDEADFLMALCQRSGCALLLDLNNLLVNGLNAVRQQHPDIDRDSALRAAQAQATAWVRRWPQGSAGHLVGEVHLAGFRWPTDLPTDVRVEVPAEVPREAPALIVDDHSQGVSPTGWALYRDTLAHLGPVPTLIEWDTDLPPLEVLLAEAHRAAACMAEAPWAERGATRGAAQAKPPVGAPP
jgi:uncharacterized protein